jgi:acylphosphatase
MTEKSFIAVVHGIVQGVWFRYYTREAALKLGITGTVKNLVTQNVEVVAEGSPEALENLLDRLHQGSPAARVSHVDVVWTPATRKFDTFSIIE